jgi:hypothetical protein
MEAATAGGAPPSTESEIGRIRELRERSECTAAAAAE